jgi:glycosyltransferase involved in cell wall biosynthesis
VDDLPSVLVVLPTLGERPETLQAALASAAGQEGVRTTIVVVVPSYAVTARTIASSVGAVVVDDPQLGLSAAVNAGIAAATDEDFFAWIGDDDEFLPDGLRTLAGLLKQRSDVVVAYGACEYMDMSDRVFAVSSAGVLARLLLPWGPDLIPQPASLTRISGLREAGPFDESLRFVMDLDMFLRLRRIGPFVSSPTRVAAYRWHPDALTVANRRESIAEAERVKRVYLPAPMRRVAPMWELPVRLAITVVSRRLSGRARSHASTSGTSSGRAASPPP